MVSSTSGRAERGTTASCTTRSRERRPIAPNAFFRPCHRRSRSPASAATRIDAASWLDSSSWTVSVSAATASSECPSSSTRSTAAASRGYPAAYTESSTARMHDWSIISRAAGTMPFAITAETASPSARSEAKAASRVRTARGNGRSRTAIRVAIPKFPSEPTNNPTTSGPHGSPPGLPSSTMRPSASTTSRASTCCAVTPYLRQCGPPAFSATLPPIVHAVWLDGSRSEEHTSELQSRLHLVCRLLLEKKKKKERLRLEDNTSKHYTTIPQVNRTTNYTNVTR